MSAAAKSNLDNGDFGHFLQSHTWEAYEQLEGEKTFWLEDDGWHALEIGRAHV